MSLLGRLVACAVQLAVAGAQLDFGESLESSRCSFSNFQARVNTMEKACCDYKQGECRNGAVPTQCTIKCAVEYVPFWTECFQIISMVTYSKKPGHPGVEPVGHGRRALQNGGHPATVPGPLKSKKSCKALGWGAGQGSDAVCAESDLSHDGISMVSPSCVDTKGKYHHSVIRGKGYIVDGCPWKGVHMAYNCKKFRSVRIHCRKSCKLCSKKTTTCHGNIGKQKTISVTQGFSHASRICKDIAARLCTAKELLAKETKGTGCGHDNQQTWSSTPCDNHRGYLSVQGDGTGKAQCNGNAVGGKQVGLGLQADLAVRCCADADVPPPPKPTGIAPWKRLQDKCTNIDSSKLLLAVKDLLSQGCHSKLLTDQCSDGWKLAASGVCFSVTYLRTY
jgi:hypothetical protein